MTPRPLSAEADVVMDEEKTPTTVSEPHLNRGRVSSYLLCTALTDLDNVSIESSERLEDDRLNVESPVARFLPMRPSFSHSFSDLASLSALRGTTSIDTIQVPTFDDRVASPGPHGSSQQPEEDLRLKGLTCLPLPPTVRAGVEVEPPSVTAMKVELYSTAAMKTAIGEQDTTLSLYLPVHVDMEMRKIWPPRDKRSMPDT
ncbi:hypothetical protein ACOMHN_036668 [Nucella lapillus]